MDNNLLVMSLLSVMSKSIELPSGFHNKVQAIKDMLADDCTGFVDSLTDFQVNSACVDFSIETDNEEFTKKLKNWLDRINIEYNGQIPSGINPLAKEYFKERWKGSSFPVLKISKWGSVNGIIVPVKMFFVDGQSIYAKDKNENDDSKKLLNYDYYLGKNSNEKLGNNIIITKPYGRWFDEYPNPYLIKRGVYHNYKIIKSIKNKESEILEKIIPYIMMIKKGSEHLSLNDIKSYDKKELQEITNKFKELMENYKNKNTPIRTANFDEEIKHLIPNLTDIFDSKLFEVAEKNILAGLGFINVTEILSTRQESILNPKVFTEETQQGVKDFKQLLKELTIKIIDKNKDKKSVDSNFYVSSSPVKSFMTDEFKRQVQRLWRSGRISDQTAVEIIGEVDFRTEVYRRKKEKTEGLDKILYPPVAENREDRKYVNPFGKEKKNEDKNGKQISPDKIDDVEKKEYNESKILEISPYKDLESLPKNVKTSLSKPLQRIWKKAFNAAYEEYDSDDTSFKIAWRVIKRVSEKNDEGKWVRKKKINKNGKEVNVRLTKSIIEEVIDYTEERLFDEINEEDKNERKDIII